MPLPRSTVPSVIRIRSSGRSVAGLLATIVLCFGPAPAVADATSGQLIVTATVVPICVVTATALAFGTYSGSQNDVTATLNITCTSTTPYYINISPGLAPNAGFDGAKMSGPGGAWLSYGVYKDSARTVGWGNTYNYDGQAGTATGSAQVWTLYAREFAGQYSAPGAYNDTAYASVTY